ncbi:hypothetical protein BDV95DRAFT_607872 [Massariosphaeria phaeospora]|uniref:Uncharacterized protein n=1 Tax=Massariosphaeria phaeospora TaxID=100035 RepID=A0A7C8M7E6_9PLEO|nr:hypothetical protein BDV95DRAFT_607872 [Massariosphaeria phaeospora]
MELLVDMQIWFRNDYDKEHVSVHDNTFMSNHSSYAYPNKSQKYVWTIMREEVFKHRNWLDKDKVDDAVRFSDQICAAVDLCSRLDDCPEW